MRSSTLVILGLVLGGLGLLVWVLLPPGTDVVLYCSVDQDHSQGLVEQFREETGLRVDFQGDVERDKSVGLARRVSEERQAPRCDVFWANEAMNTAWLADAGAFDPLPQDVLDLFPPAFRDPRGQWVAFGLRARVLLVNTELLPDRADWPRRVADLLDPRYGARGLATALARPLAGTTYTHAVALLTRDEAGARAFLEGVARAAAEGRVRITTGNGPAMQLASDASNRVAFCLTDTDDAWDAKRKGRPVEIVYPDQGEGEWGTLVIPNTLAWVKGRPHPEAATRLLRWLAAPALEARLAHGPSAQMPVRPGVPVPADGHVKRPGSDFRVAEVDWAQLARNRDRWLDLLDRVLQPAR
jgi:iron(III) transport system substrate-binding protein